jgi:hypothetical protein
MKAIATSHLVEFADDSVASAMKQMFSQPEICHLDVADGLKQLLYEKRYDLNSLLQSDIGSVAQELGIEEYVAKIIINAAKEAKGSVFLVAN